MGHKKIQFKTQQSYQETIDEIENEKTFEKFVDRIADFWW